MSRGVVAAGHAATAEAGAWALREGGNAVDAAIAAVLASLSAESPLTGLGAGGHMLVHRPGEEPVLLDFFVAAPGLDGSRRTSELVPVEVDFGGVVQVFNVGAASCGVPGVPSGMAEAVRRFGSMPLSELVRPGVQLARDGIEVNRQQAYLFSILAPILIREPAGKAIYAPNGSPLGVGERVSFAGLAETLERFGAEGPEPFYRGDIAAAIAKSVATAGGYLGEADLAAYETIARTPARAFYGEREILTNPPPSSGGILIAFALELLERLGADDPETLIAVMEEAQGARTREFLAGLYEEAFAGQFLTEDAIEAAAARCRASVGGGNGLEPDDHLGSTTPHHRDGRGGGLRHRHLFERQRLRALRRRHRDPAQQHARRGGPEPVRLPRHRGGAPDAVDDVADGRPP